jgi:ABC-type transporter Mla subunit MlaD
MISFTTKAAGNVDLTIKHDLDSIRQINSALFEFSQREYERLRRTLENLGQFTCTTIIIAVLIMTNFEMVWE